MPEIPPERIIVTLPDLAEATTGITIGDAGKPLVIAFGRKNRSGDYPQLNNLPPLPIVFLDMVYALYSHLSGSIVVDEQGRVDVISSANTTLTQSLGLTRKGSRTIIHIFNPENMYFFAYFEVCTIDGQYVLQYHPQDPLMATEG